MGIRQHIGQAGFGAALIACAVAAATVRAESFSLSPTAPAESNGAAAAASAPESSSSPWASSLIAGTGEPPRGDLSIEPRYLQVDPASRRPFMRLLNRFGWAEPLERNGIDIYGFIQGSYAVSLNEPHQDDPLGDDPARNRIQGRMFDHHSNLLALNRFDVFIQRAVDYTLDRWDLGGLVEFQYGIDAAMMHSNGLFDYDWFNYENHAEPEYQFDLTQLYADLAIPLGNGLRLRGGKFATLIGYESCDPTTRTQIQFYSRSWILTLGIPMYQTGAMATYNLSDRVTLNAGVTRGWDQAMEDINDSLDFLGGVNVELSDQFTVFGGVSAGPQQPDDDAHWRTLINGILYYTPERGGPWSFAVDTIFAWENNQVGGDGSPGFFQTTTPPGVVYDQSNDDVPVGDTYWFGIAAFAAYRINPNLVAKGRAEWFYDADGTRWRFPAAQSSYTAAVMNNPFVQVGRSYSAFEFTAGLDIIPFPNDAKELLVRPEIRVDLANHDIFTNANDNFQVTVAVDVIYKF